MIFNVQMLAHNPDDWFSPRPVTVPDEECQDADVFHILERIFHWGQNMHQNIGSRNINGFEGDYGDWNLIPCCSVSMGDVAELYGKLYLCKACGWEEITPEQLAEYKEIPRLDRCLCDLMRD